ncbi:hypothetical protein ABT299_39930 [Spirillospora sp. NPDC000708]
MELDDVQVLPTADKSLAMTPLSLARGFVAIIDGVTMQYLADRGHRRPARDLCTAHRRAADQRGLLHAIATSAGRGSPGVADVATSSAAGESVR